jgi:Lon protease-like protein
LTTDHNSYEQAVFPLNTVLFPGGILPLQIFEQRYIELVKSCMTDDHGFVVALISSGKEVGGIPEIYSTATYAEIIDWDSLQNSLLGITIKGSKRVNILSTSVSKNGTLLAQTKNSGELENCSINNPDNYHKLTNTLQQLSSHPYVSQRYKDIDYSSSIEVCYKLSELLPVTNIVKQDLLESHDLNSQIEKLTSIINDLGG